MIIVSAVIIIIFGIIIFLVFRGHGASSEDFAVIVPETSIDVTDNPVNDSAVSPVLEAPIKVSENTYGKEHFFHSGSFFVPVKGDVLGRGLELSFSMIYLHEDLGKEIERKSREIRIIVREAVAGRGHRQLDRESLRKECMEKINSFLSRGKIIDFEFKTFKRSPL
ncbi:MAG: hypothetical protein ACLFQK_04985 [Fibrobacterota bacterium]